jgi:hypothetical protein
MQQKKVENNLPVRPARSSKAAQIPGAFRDGTNPLRGVYPGGGLGRFAVVFVQAHQMLSEMVTGTPRAVVATKLFAREARGFIVWVPLRSAVSANFLHRYREF